MAVMALMTMMLRMLLLMMLMMMIQGDKSCRYARPGECSNSGSTRRYAP